MIEKYQRLLFNFNSFMISWMQATIEDQYTSIVKRGLKILLAVIIIHSKIEDLFSKSFSNHIDIDFVFCSDLVHAM